MVCFIADWPIATKAKREMKHGCRPILMVLWILGHSQQHQMTLEKVLLLVFFVLLCTFSVLNFIKIQDMEELNTRGKM